MKKISYYFAFLLAVLLFGSSTASAATINFADVPATAEYSQEIAYISDLGIIKGYKENGKSLFKPENTVTRSQAAKMLVIATKNQNITGAAISFPDVKKNTEEYSYISKAVKLGYFKGFPDGSFKPHEPLKRGQMSKVIAKAFGIEQPITLTTPLMFDDVSLTYENASKINGLYYKGIARGSNGKFMVTESLTRGQFSMFLSRALSTKFVLPVVKASQTEIAKGIVDLKSTNDFLNVRSSPSDGGKVIGKLKHGSKVSVVKDQGDWVEIKHLTRPAFVHKGFIEFLDADSKPIGLATHFVKINTATLNVRNAPSASATLMGSFKSNEVIEVHGEKNGWYLVLFNGLPGYINKSYTVNYVVSKPPIPATNGTLIGKVTVSSLNMRSAPNATSSIVNKLTTGNQVTVLSIDGYWAKVKYGSSTGYVHKSYLKLLNSSGGPLKNRIIVLDAGHGGKDPGASKNGITEKSIALDVSKRVEAKLKAAGAQVLMTRKSDVFPTLQDRVDFARKHYAESFVSIHVNAASSTAAKGAEVFFDTSANDNGLESKYLATDIQQRIVQYVDMQYRGVFDREFYVIRNQDIPAVLVELGFISNSSDFSKLTNPADLEKYSKAIYDGIFEYYSAP
ncbi:N-acetylmuramoyl-L-alanine amidase [Planococcus glaciei]|uniref:N-acetylmuramoyl-L-alanine amidase n=1 Tax=Planococcus glaciei TaxID=459472 RepID=UPI001C73898F|nr:N-acetylmuramoyl-L-alanine amidase [Planococcus glaciei]MBX0316846.1 N-acetylmuramoyl-L-alanine amidase [Planococcus glaciei]